MGTEQYYNAVYASADELVKGISKLQENYDTFDKAIVNFADLFINLSVNILKLGTAVTQLTESYGQFDSGINENTDGVAEVATDTADTAKKLNFWQKLLKLFGLFKE